MKYLLILLTVGVILIPALAFSESSVIPAIPHLINYQGMLTDNSGTPLTGNFDIVFKIYNDASAGTMRWQETQSGVSVNNGLFSVILGSVTPINLAFEEEYWLDLTVGGEHMPSRLKFTSVGYAYRAQKADTAAYASGVLQADLDSRYVNVNGPDSVRGTNSSYMLRIKNYGTGDGIQIYSPSSSTGDGLAIDSAGDNGIEITDTKNNGIWMDDIHGYGVYMSQVTKHGIYLYTAGWDGLYVYSAKNGVDVQNADTGLFIRDNNYEGIVAYGDRGGGEFYSNSSSYYAIRAHSLNNLSTNPALYVFGHGGITGSWSTKLSSSEGDVPGFMVSSTEVELIASGTGTLVNGKAEVTFKKEFQEAISTDIPVRVVMTAQGAPSGLLYVESKSNQGFTVNHLEVPGLEAKVDNITFDWIAIARQKGYEQSPEVNMPAAEEWVNLKQTEPPQMDIPEEPENEVNEGAK